MRWKNNKLVWPTCLDNNVLTIYSCVLCAVKYQPKLHFNRRWNKGHVNLGFIHPHKPLCTGVFMYCLPFFFFYFCYISYCSVTSKPLSDYQIMKWMMKLCDKWMHELPRCETFCIVLVKKCDLHARIWKPKRMLVFSRENGFWVSIWSMKPFYIIWCMWIGKFTRVILMHDPKKL